MDLLDLLPVEHVAAPLRAPDLRTAILQLAGRLRDSGAATDIGALEERIRQDPIRELTAITDEVVLPHYRTDAVDSLCLALGLAPEPIPAGEGSEVRARVVALILAPMEAAALYLQTMSTLARLFRQEGVLDELVRQPDAESVRALDRLQDLKIQHTLVVRDVMTHRIHSVPPDATVRRTLDLMLRRKLQAVPVVGEQGEVVGIVTESDLMRTLLPQIPRAGADETPEGGEPQAGAVRDIMTRSVLCVSEDLGLSEVASMMINKDVEQVPVVHAGSITGMVHRGDIIRKLFGRS